MAATVSDLPQRFTVRLEQLRGPVRPAAPADRQAQARRHRDRAVEGHRRVHRPPPGARRRAGPRPGQRVPRRRRHAARPQGRPAAARGRGRRRGRPRAARGPRPALRPAAAVQGLQAGRGVPARPGRSRPPRRFARDAALEPRFAELLPEVLLGLGPRAVRRPRRPGPGRARGPEVVSVAHLHAPAVSVAEQLLLVREHLARTGDGDLPLPDRRLRAHARGGRPVPGAAGALPAAAGQLRAAHAARGAARALDRRAGADDRRAAPAAGADVDEEYG